MGSENVTVTFRIDHTPLYRLAVQFEWASYNKAKNETCSGISVFALPPPTNKQQKSVTTNAARSMWLSGGARPVARLSRIDARLMNGLIRALWRPQGP